MLNKDDKRRKHRNLRSFFVCVNGKAKEVVVVYSNENPRSGTVFQAQCNNGNDNNN